jgi:anthranilate synthase component II
MKIVIIDNYDSFTYNLVHAVEHITQQEIDVFRNDEIALTGLEKYDHIILSPGPGIPSEAGLLLDIIKTYAPTKKMLGVCLGHQAIGEVFGGNLHNLNDVFHGLAKNTIVINDDVIFNNMPTNFETGRYHSWVVDKENFPTDLDITATDDEGLVMALKHKIFNVRGVQFHPESVLTPLGNKILENWIKLA